MIKRQPSEDTMILELRAYKLQDTIDFFKELEKLIRAGWTIKTDCSPRECPLAPVVKNLHLVDRMSDVNNLSKKVDLLELADRLGVEIEDPKLSPMSIKKIIREHLEGLND